MDESSLEIQIALSELQGRLQSWYRENHRSYPWRDTTDPFQILVAEVMSQQTQLDRIVEPWGAFLDRWPTIDSLAQSDRADIVGFWSEHRLGYNNRARYLHEAANVVVDEFDGRIPQSPEELKTLPGVGPYTANAVASFAFNNGDAVVDTNVKRVLFRAFDVHGSDADFISMANKILPPDHSRTWNNAIMELGAVVCKKIPRCDDGNCPWRDTCRAYLDADFSAPDVPNQSPFEGSHRQLRGQVIRLLHHHGSLSLDELDEELPTNFPRYKEEDDRLLSLVTDLVDDGLVSINDEDIARLKP